MSTYNEARPKSFGEIVGQEPVTRYLNKQCKLHKWHHAYLFSGPSGTGKTTTARVLAAALNCGTMNGTGEPCGICPSCRNVVKGSHWDVMEIDAADNRQIADVRKLKSMAPLAPMGKTKVWIMDECHRFTPEAWDCLLKLIEEPPPNLKIILCTTDATQVPETVQSRCVCLEFVAITSESARLKLLRINPSVSERILDKIEEKFGDNMRKAENLLEQMTLA